MSPRPYQASNDKHAYIPPHIEQAMNQHLQQSLSPNLRKYVGADRPTYIPANIERQINQQMQKNMPTHLKQYTGAYMQHQMVRSISEAGFHSNASRMATDLPSRPPTPSTIKRDHSLPVGEQFNMPLDVAHEGYIASRHASRRATSAQVQPAVEPLSTASGDPYEFITSPEAPPKKNIFNFNFLKGSSSMPRRILVVLGGGIILITLLIVISSLFGGKSDTSGLLSLAQQQNELIRVSLEASDQVAQQTTGNAALDIQLVLTTDQQQLVTYMKNNGHKPSAKQLGATQSAATDQQLQTAQTASDYDMVYLQIMQTGLNKYVNGLKQAYVSTTGPIGRKLLNTDYQNATTLLNQVNSAEAALNS